MSDLIPPSVSMQLEVWGVEDAATVTDVVEEEDADDPVDPVLDAGASLIVHLQFASALQELEQQSPLTVFPSSHSSPTSGLRFPQTADDDFALDDADELLAELLLLEEAAEPVLPLDPVLPVEPPPPVDAALAQRDWMHRSQAASIV